MNWGALAAILGGNAVQGVGQGLDRAAAEELKREALAKEEAREMLRIAMENKRLDAEAARHTETQAARMLDLSALPAPLQEVLGASGTIPRDLAGELYRANMDQRALAREQATRGAQADILSRMGAGSPGLPKAPMPDEAAMYSEAESIPAVPGKPADPRLTAAAELMRVGKIDPTISKILGLEEETWKPLPQDSPGLYNRAGQIRPTGMGGQPAGGLSEQPPARPGFEWVQSVDKSGRPSWREERVSLGPEAEREARALGFESFAQAPRDVQAKINAKIDQRVGENSPAAGAKAAALIMAKSGAEKELPLAQVNLHGQVVWDKTTKQTASMATKLGDVLANPNRYAFLSGEKQVPQMLAITEAKLLLGQFVPLVEGLTKTPGANFAQAASMRAQTKAGVENPGVAFDALKGTILRLAGAMQGSRVQLSDQDRKAVEGMLPTPMDTAQSGMQRLQTVMGVLHAMEAAQLGDFSVLTQANETLRKFGGTGTLGMGGSNVPTASPAPTGGGGWKIERVK